MYTNHHLWDCIPEGLTLIIAWLVLPPIVDEVVRVELILSNQLHGNIVI